MQKKLHLYHFLILAVMLTSCTTIGKNKPVLVEHPERFFWEIKTNTAKVYILGTINVADSSFYPLEQPVIQAFTTADYLVSEIGGKDMIATARQQIEKKIIKSMVPPESKKSLSHFLSRDEIAVLEQFFTSEMLFTFLQCEPWVLQYALFSRLIEYSTVSSEDGIDQYLMEKAGNRPIDALENLSVQIELISEGSFEEQMAILHRTISDIRKRKVQKQLMLVVDAYKKNNKKELERIILDMDELPDSFSKAQKKHISDRMFKNRNKQWAKKIHSYLNRNGTTFIFAGAGHFLGKDSVFNQLGLSK